MVCVGRRGQINHFNEIIMPLIVRIIHGIKQCAITTWRNWLLCHSEESIFNSVFLCGYGLLLWKSYA